MVEGKRSILIVDDEEDVLTLHQIVFEASGFVARTASSGKAAVASSKVWCASPPRRPSASCRRSSSSR